MDDTITITCVRPTANQTITVTIPPAMVGLLDWLAANVKNSDGSPKYMYGLNVIWQDVIAQLVPVWRQRYMEGQLASQVAQITQLVAQGVQGTTVVGP